MSSIKIDLSSLVRDGVITPQTRGDIEAWHARNTSHEGISRFLQVFATLGAVATGLGVILTIAANWDSIGDALKTAILIGGTLSIYLTAYYFRYIHTDFRKTGEALFLLGSLMYGASIFLLGQIYNLGGSFYQALGLWALGVIPLAYTTGLFSVFLLGIALTYGFLFSYAENSGTLSQWGIANIFSTLGFFLLAGIRHHEKIFPSFNKVLATVGSASLLGGLFAYTFLDFWHDGYSRSAVEVLPIELWIAITLIAFSCISTAIGIVSTEKYSHIRDTPFLVGAIMLTILTLLAPFEYTSDIRILLCILMNILFLLLLCIMVYMGIARKISSIVNTAIIFFGIYLFGKYLAFVFESKMDGAIVFLSGGVIVLLITGLTEAIRRRILRNVTSS